MPLPLSGRLLSRYFFAQRLSHYLFLDDTYPITFVLDDIYPITVFWATFTSLSFFNYIYSINFTSYIVSKWNKTQL